MNSLTGINWILKRKDKFTYEIFLFFFLLLTYLLSIFIPKNKNKVGVIALNPYFSNAKLIIEKLKENEFEVEVKRILKDKSVNEGNIQFEKIVGNILKNSLIKDGIIKRNGKQLKR